MQLTMEKDGTRPGRGHGRSTPTSAQANDDADAALNPERHGWAPQAMTAPSDEEVDGAAGPQQRRGAPKNLSKSRRVLRNGVPSSVGP